MKVEDYYPNGKRWWLRLHEKGGKFHELPAHHTPRRTSTPTSRPRASPTTRRGRCSAPPGENRDSSPPGSAATTPSHDRRRAVAAGLSDRICCHTFRATGITAYLEAGGTIEKAQQIAAHESAKTTKLYDRRDQITLDEIERIGI